MMTRLTAAALLTLFSTSAMAQDAPSDIVRLTPAQRAAVLDAASVRPNRGLDGGGYDRAVHGEVGLEIGSRGERAVYGTAIVPLGDNASAAISFFDGRTGRWRQR